MRIYAGLIIVIAYLAWVLYHLIIKKDLKKNLDGFYAYTAFAAIWTAIYLFAILS